MHIYIRSGNRPIIIKANVITENPPAVASIQHATIIRLERTLQTEKAMAARITNITPIPKIPFCVSNNAWEIVCHMAP